MSDTNDISIINLCPHPITVCGPDGQVLRTWEKAATYARLDVSHTGEARLGGVPTAVPTKGQPGLYTDGKRVADFPAAQVGTYYIVPTMLREALPERWDLLSPSTNPKWSVRDADGRTVGTLGFDRNR